MLFRLDFHAYLRSLRQSSFFLSFYKFLRRGSELSVAFNSDRVLGSSLWQWISFYVVNNNVFGVILIRNLYFSLVYLYLKMIFLLPSKIKEANENLWDFGSLNFLCTDVCSSIIKILMQRNFDNFISELLKKIHNISYFSNIVKWCYIWYLWGRCPIVLFSCCSDGILFLMKLLHAILLV